MKLADLPDLPPNGLYRGLVYHWSAGRYRKFFDHYNLCVLGPHEDFVTRTATTVSIADGENDDGEIVLTHPILNNLRKIRHGIDEYAPHTRSRNSGRIGISAMCMYEATPDRYGDFPPTGRQIEAMCAVGGLVVAKYGQGISIEQQVFTHFQYAKIDGYYPDRWDWMREGPTLLGKTRYYALLQGWHA